MILHTISFENLVHPYLVHFYWGIKYSYNFPQSLPGCKYLLSCTNKCGKKNVSKKSGHFLIESHTHENVLNSELQISLTNVYFYEIKHWLYTF